MARTATQAIRVTEIPPGKQRTRGGSNRNVNTMQRRRKVVRIRDSAALAFLLTSPAFAQTSGANQTHDPSRLLESDGRFYFCSTGGGCASSSDGLVWERTGLRISIPDWVDTYLPNGNQGVWAPDIIYFQGKYHIYYSVCGLPAAQAPCLIGLYTTPTLDSTSPSYELTDVGMVVNNPPNDDTYQFSTIDAGPIIDPAGDLWTCWGSGYGKDQSRTQLWLTRLDDTGLPLASDPAYTPPAVLGYALQPGRKEGPYLYFHEDYYYLFYNTGSCCNGTASDYTIWVARSRDITGPFADDEVFYASNGDIHGPGHMGIYDACGVERFTYHYYPTSTSVLGLNELSWDSDGWPVAGPVSTTPLVPCGNPGAGGAGGAPAAGGTGPGSGGTEAGGTGAGGTGVAGTDAGGTGAGGTHAGGTGGTDAGGTGAGGTATGGTATGGSATGGTATGGTAATTGGIGVGAAGSGGTNYSGGAGTSASGATGGSESSLGGASPQPVGESGGQSDGAAREAASSDTGCTCAVGRPASSPLPFPWWVGALGLIARVRRSRRQQQKAGR